MKNIWKVCPTFNSALLEDEKDGERLNEILCATCDEAECLVELLNELTKRAEKAEARVDHYAELINKADDKVLKLEAEVERLRANLRRAIEITEIYSFHLIYPSLEEEIKQLKATL